MKEESILQKKKFNIRMYPIYKALSWDLLFYYSISFLFLTQAKGISAAQVLFSDAFYPIFKFILQIPCTPLVNHIGKKNSMVLGNILVGFSVLVLVFATGLPIIIFSNFLSAFGYVLKGLSEDVFLYDSIPRSKKRNDLFSRISGKGSAWYYYINALTATGTGFLFVWNAYLPMLLSTAICFLTAFIAYRFIDTRPEKAEVQEEKTSSVFKENILGLKEGFKFIFRSNRLRGLIIFYAIGKSLLSILSTLRSSILSDLQVPNQYFGIIFAVLGIVSGIAAQNSLWFHKRFRNKTLKWFAYSLSFSMIAIGLSVIVGLNIGLCLEIILIGFLFQYIAAGPFHTLIQRYLNSFSNSSMRIKISSASDLVYGLLRALLCFIASGLMGMTSTAYVFAILGCLFTIFFIFLLDYMKDKVGLKPEQYAKKDIEYKELQ